MTADWGAAAGIVPFNQARVDSARRGGVPLEWLLHSWGYHAEQDGDRLVLPCPFHPDNNPSFTIRVAEDGTELAGCWSCPDKQQGDLFDLIRWLTGAPNFPAAYQYLTRLENAYAEDAEWHSLPRRKLTAAPKANPEDLGALAVDAYKTALGNNGVLLQEMITWKSQTAPGWAHLTPNFLMAEWGVGQVPDRTETKRLSNPDGAPYASDRRVIRGQQIVVPHYDPEGLCRALKTRYVGGKLISMRGSDLSYLYGAWKPQKYDTVLVCEGESDAWVASRLFGGRMDVRALPSGATGPKPAWIDYLRRWPHIVLAFDGDDAGRKAIQLWTR